MNSTTGWQTGYNGNDLSLASPQNNLSKFGWGDSSTKTYSSPLAHPDSWPQLGEAIESSPQKPDMHQQPAGNMQQQDVGGWGGGPSADSSGTVNSWGAPQPSGWGNTDVGGGNWSRQPQVDNGTAVWGKPSQSSAGWGAPASSAPSGGGWGAPTQSAQSPGIMPNSAPQEPTPQKDPQQSPQVVQQQQQQLSNPQSQGPESWAAAAAAPPAQPQPVQNTPMPSTDQQAAAGTEAEVDPNNGQAQQQPQQPTQEQKVAEMQDNVPISEEDDAMQKLVNSHEGWGKRPIQQNTSWDISESPNFARQSSSKTGTEAWGKIPPGQGAGAGAGWSEQPSKQAWQGNSGGPPDQSTQQWMKPTNGQNPPARGWAAPNQQQQPRLSWSPSQPAAGNQSGWGDPRLPPPVANMNSNRWPTPPNPMQNSNSQGWSAPQASNPGGWNNPPPTAENNSWAAAGMQRNPQGNSNWGAGGPSASGPEPNTWSQPQPPNMQRHPSQVDDGTSAWGDPTAYKNVNMWSKKQGMGMGDASQAKPEATGWGAPVGPTQGMPNKPPSPTGWGDANPGRPMADNSNSSWGKPGSISQNSNWDQNSGWGMNKPVNNSGWGGATEQPTQQWGQGDGWNQQSVKNDLGGPKNVEFAGGFVDRKPSTGSDSVFEDSQLDANGQSLNMGMPGSGRPGMNFGQFPGAQPNNPGMPGMNGPRPVPPQPLMSQPNLQAQMMQGRGPPMPPQLQNQLQQIRQAVMKGVIPQQMLNPQLMTPQHLNLLQQLVIKTGEYQQLLSRMNLLNKPNLPPHLRPQQEQTARMLQQCQQQIQAHQRALTQNMLQKTNQLQAKTNTGGMGPGGLDLPPPSSGALPPSNSSISPFNMSSLAQNMPGAGNSSTAIRDQQSRLSSWRRPSMGMDGGADNGTDPSLPPMMSHASISDMIGVQGGLLPPSGGPGSDLMNQARVTGGGLLGLQQPDGTSAIGHEANEANGARKEFEMNGSGQNQNAPDEGGAQTSPTGGKQDGNGEDLFKDIGPPEFIPGVKWKGFRPIDPENDPDITPGSVAIAKTMSVNTVKDVDQVLNRDRYTNSQVGSPASNSGDARSDIQSQSLASSFANTMNDNPAISSSAWSTATGGGGSSLSHAPTSLTHELWKVPLPKQSSMSNHRATPGGFPSQNSGWPSGPASSWASAPNAASAGRYSAAGSENSGWVENKTWVVLTNLNPQTDFNSLRNLCSMKGNMLSFQPNYPMRGMVLVRYSSPDDAMSAKKALNMSMSGNTMLVASIASDQEVSNIVTASAGNSWNAGPNQSRFSSRNSFGSSGTMLSNQQQQQPPQSHFGSGPMMHGSASTGDMQRLWSSGGNGNTGHAGFGGPPSSTSWSTGANPLPGRGMGGGSSMWGSMMGGYDDPTRMMSPLHSLLPENLLGGEMM